MDHFRMDNTEGYTGADLYLLNCAFEGRGGHTARDASEADHIAERVQADYDTAKAAALLGRRGGLKGGKATGARKRRGDSAYYRALAAKRPKEFDRIDSDQYALVLAGKHTQGAEYGGRPERTTATGRAHCRFCGMRIQKGAPAIRWAHDFLGSGSWTAVTCYVHGIDCR